MVIPILMFPFGLPEERFEILLFQGLAENIIALDEIPVAELAELMVGGESAHLLIYEAWDALRAKMDEIRRFKQARQCEQELIEIGRVVPRP